MIGGSANDVAAESNQAGHPRSIVASRPVGTYPASAHFCPDGRSAPKRVHRLAGYATRQPERRVIATGASVAAEEQINQENQCFAV